VYVCPSFDGRNRKPAFKTKRNQFFSPTIFLKMDLNTLIVILVVGAVAGWLAGVIRQGYGFGLLGNIVVGILGSFLGHWLFGALGIHIGSGIVGHIITAVIGALVLLFLIGLVRRGGSA
jgi:uncharacterized membrane protein YeaQ/YmgE (transglycosylase-associated protein family)